MAKALVNISYDPDAVANPQFTIRVLMLIVLIAAVLLGALQYLAR